MMKQGDKVAPKNTMYGILRLTMTTTKESSIALLLEYDWSGIVIPVLISIGAVNVPKSEYEACEAAVVQNAVYYSIIVLTMDIARTSS